MGPTIKKTGKGDCTKDKELSEKIGGPVHRSTDVSVLVEA